MPHEDKEIMIIQDGCGHCDEAKVLLKDKIANGKVEPVDAFSERGKAYVNKYNIDATPTILSGTENNFKKCLLSPDGKKIHCEDGSEKVI